MWFRFSMFWFIPQHVRPKWPRPGASKIDETHFKFWVFKYFLIENSPDRFRRNKWYFFFCSSVCYATLFQNTFKKKFPPRLLRTQLESTITFDGCVHLSWNFTNRQISVSGIACASFSSWGHPTVGIRGTRSKKQCVHFVKNAKRCPNHITEKCWKKRIKKRHRGRARSARPLRKNIYCDASSKESKNMIFSFRGSIHKNLIFKIFVFVCFFVSSCFFLIRCARALGTRRHPIKQPPNICVSLGGFLVGDNGCAGPVCVVAKCNLNFNWNPINAWPTIFATEIWSRNQPQNFRSGTRWRTRWQNSAAPTFPARASHLNVKLCGKFWYQRGALFKRCGPYLDPYLGKAFFTWTLIWGRRVT